MFELENIPLPEVVQLMVLILAPTPFNWYDVSQMETSSPASMEPNSIISNVNESCASCEQGAKGVPVK